MRDFIVIAFILAAAPVCLFRPYVGVLMWTWIAYFNPHRFTWGFAYDFPVALVIAVPTLLGTIFTRSLNNLFLARETLLLFALWLWFGLTYLHATHVPLFAAHIADSQSELVRVSKILLMTAVAILVVTSRKQLKGLILVTTLSLGLLGIKGALFGLRTAGVDRVYGPPESFLDDNNAFGLALNMTLPMLFFLAQAEENRLLRRLLNIAFLSGILSVILTYSRGGLLGLAAVLGFIAWKSRYRFIAGFLLLIGAFMVMSFAPEQWTARMGGMVHGDIDGSAKQRLVAWRTAWNFAQDYPIMGGGFQALPNVDLFQRYQSEPLPGGFASTGPHSIYFQELEEHGFVGLGLYLLLLASCLVSMHTLCRQAQRLSHCQWVIPYTYMIQGSLLAFLVSGTFLGFSQFDLYFQMVAAVAVLKILFRRDALRLVTPEKDSVPEIAELVTP